MTATRFRARWVVPIVSPPIAGGWVEVDGGVVRAVGPAADAPSAAIRSDVELGACAILPGLVNAHTHLELSDLRGRVPAAGSMPYWARAVMQARSAAPPSPAAVASAVRELRRAGTALVGDITNTLDAVAVLDAGPVDAVVFHEHLGFDVTATEARRLVEPVRAAAAPRTHARVRIKAAAHAPYSVSAPLFRALVDAVPGPRSVHLAESPEEIAFLRHGGGAWRDVLEERGRWDGRWIPPGVGPVAYLAQVGWLRPDTLAVHGVHLTSSEMRALAATGTTIVTCPRSNQWTGAGVPPLAGFYAHGMHVAVGTDSLASAPDLNLFAELAEMRRLAPGVAARRLLASATRVGAAALGRPGHGAIAPGRRAALIAVTLPDAVSDVEEYLVSGIVPDQVTWLSPS